MNSNDSPNRLYRVVWNACQGVWQAVAETGKGRTRSVSAGRVARRLQAAALASMAASGAFAADGLPVGGHVTAGNGTITTGSGSVLVNQSTDRLAIDWQSFNIGAGNQVRFVQPSTDSVALNRVTGSDPSVIQGALTANGHVFLINPNGVLFTPTARVDVGGLTASTLALSNDDFLGGRWRFSGTSGNAVVNQGRITTTAGGTVAFVAARIVNDGSIVAPQGHVLMGAGSQVTLDLGGPVQVKVERAALDALIRNGGAIVADGGVVYLDARATGDLVSTVINQTGTIEARTLATGEQGRIVLLGDMHNGRVEVGGTIDASAPAGGDGGSIETSASSVKVANDFRVTTASARGRTGTWLLDPYDVTIAASGGDVTGATISTALDSTNVVIDTTNTTYGSTAGVGNITVDDAITRTSGSGITTLTLQAHNDIDVNAAITSTNAPLNVVLTADQDNAGGGSVHFGAGGHVVTHGGNFYVGSVSGTYDTLAATAQDLTMATGSYVDVGTGNLGIAVKGDITLPDNSAQDITYAFKATANTGWRTFNSGYQAYWTWLPFPYNQAITLTSTGSGAITTANTGTTNADIVSGVDVALSAGTIGSSGARLRISGLDDPYGLGNDPVYSTLTFPQVGRALRLTNTTGSSYVDEVGTQIFSAIQVTVGNQASAVQDLRILGDTAGTGHLHLHNDGSGTLALGTGDVMTGGVAGADGADPLVFPTSVVLYAPAITFANGSVDTGTGLTWHPQGAGSYWQQNGYTQTFNASFTAGAPTMTSSQVDGIADIRSDSLSLVATDLGTSTHPVEVGAGTSLQLGNTGGSTFVKVTDDTFTSITLNTQKATGEHHVLWSGGDHIDLLEDSLGMLVPTLTGGRSDGADFTATQGVDLSGSNRDMAFVANSGVIRFDTNSVNLGGGRFQAIVASGDTDRVAGKAIYAVNSMDNQAEITAGNVELDVYNDGGTAASIKGLEFAHGGTATDNYFKAWTWGGDIDVKELSTHHFQSINLYLYGSQQPQTVRLRLAGADEVNLVDDGTKWLLSPTTVALSDGNRNWNLETPYRAVQVDGTSLGTGSYRLATNTMYLNGDILTNGGGINLSAGGNGIVAMRPVTIGSNADDAGNTTHTGDAGSIWLYAGLSASAPGATLAVDARSTTGYGNSIYWLYGNAMNYGGEYLAGLTFDARGASPGLDGGVGLYWMSNVLLKGSFASYGNTSLYGNITIDTEQGNTGNAGDITFGGNSLYTFPYCDYRFDTSTTATGGVAGRIDLYGTASHSAVSVKTLVAVATGGDGGEDGDILLPGIDTTWFRGDGPLSATGRTIQLGGDLWTNRSDITLTGDVQAINDVTIRTMRDDLGATTGTAGSVTIDGAIGATSAGRTLTIDTSANTGGDWADPGTYTTPMNYSGGAVTITGGTATTGVALGTLNVVTSALGEHNSGTHGAITVAGAHGVTTSVAQNYTGGTLAVDGAITTDALRVETLDTGTTIGGTGLITAGSAEFVGHDTTYALTRGGAGESIGRVAISGAADITLLDGTRSLTIDTVGGTSGLSATGLVDVATGTGSLTIAADVATTSDASQAVVLQAGRDAVAGSTRGGNVKVVGAPTISVGDGGSFVLYTGSVSGSTGVAELLGAGSGRFRYDSTDAVSNFTAALGTGGYAVYREQPVIDVSASDSKTYDGVAYSGGNVAITGLVNGDTDGVLHGTLTYAGSAQGAINAGTYTLEVASGSLTNDLGYAIHFNTTGTLVIDKASLTVTANNGSKTYDGQAWTGGNGVSYSGFVSGDNAGNSLGGTLAWGGTSQGAINAGTYGITASGYTSGNYDITYVPGTLTVDKASLTVTASNGSKTYDGQAWNGGNGVSYSGFVSGDNAGNSLGGTLHWGGTSQGAINAGTYGITASGLTSGNYDITYVPGTLTVDKASLTVTAGNGSKTYDGQAWSGGNGVSYSGFVSGDNAGNSLGGTLHWGGTSQGAINAGTYGITASGYTSGNYDITYVPGTLTVDKASLTVTAGNGSKTYDGQAWSGGNGVSYSGFVSGDNAGNSLGGTLHWGGTSQGAINAGTYGITASGYTSGNYDITYVPGTLTVDKASLTVTAGNGSKTYDGQAWSGGNGVSYSGFVSGDNAGNSLGGTLHWGGTSQGAINAGTYGITASGYTSGNYDITYVPGTLTVDKASLVVTANNGSKTYDGLGWTGGNGVSYSGFVSGDNAGNSLGGTLAWGGTSQGAVNAGTYGITASGYTSGNYDITYAAGTLTIDKATLVVTAGDAWKYVDGRPWTGGNGVGYSGFVAGDNAANSLGGTLTWGGTSQGAIRPGDYTIGASGLTAMNYELVFVDGRLQIRDQPIPVVTSVTLVQTGATTFTPPNPGTGLQMVSVDGAAGVPPVGALPVGPVRVFVVDGGVRGWGGAAGGASGTGAGTGTGSDGAGGNGTGTGTGNGNGNGTDDEKRRRTTPTTVSSIAP